MSSNADTLKRLRADAVARGLCYVCRFRFPRPGVRTCDDCIERSATYKKTTGKAKERARHAAQMARSYASCVADGTCTRCKRIAACDGRTQCSVCLDIQAAKMISRSRLAGRKARQHTCSFCGQRGHYRTRHERPGMLPEPA